MLRKLIICPYFGTLPDYFPQWYENAHSLREHGYDFLLDSDLDGFNRRVHERLGATSPITEGSSKIHDYRCTFGVLYADELAAYDFWGHTDFDCVYGRVNRFWPDALLTNVDLLADHSYVCGPWSLYRNHPTVNELFQRHPDWLGILEGERVTGWVETGYTDLVRESGIRVEFTSEHAYEVGDLKRLRWDGGRLLVGAREVPMAHFRRTKEWPAGLAA